MYLSISNLISLIMPKISRTVKALIKVRKLILILKRFSPLRSLRARCYLTSTVLWTSTSILIIHLSLLKANLAIALQLSWLPYLRNQPLMGQTLLMLDFKLRPPIEMVPQLRKVIHNRRRSLQVINHQVACQTLFKSQVLVKPRFHET
jgi:hypothetical protein